MTTEQGKKDKRKAADRRKRDVGLPPGWKQDRRRTPERRMIGVEETTMEEYEAWLAPGELLAKGK